MTPPAAARRPFEVRGWHVLAALLGFFAFVIAVNVGFAVVAVRSFPGEDVRRSYLQGLTSFDTLAARREQAALGWRARARMEGDAEAAAVVVELRSRGGEPIDAATVTGVLRWPTDARRDRTLAFESIGEGRYSAPTGALPPGRWQLRASAENAAGGALDFEAELTWRTSH
jgi:nitrogen fixation protein FixH